MVHKASIQRMVGTKNISGVADQMRFDSDCLFVRRGSRSLQISMNLTAKEFWYRLNSFCRELTTFRTGPVTFNAG